MARLQILELPEGDGDERRPFVLVVDEVVTGPDGELLIKSTDFEGVLERMGAQAVLVFEETIDIPANDTVAYIQQAAEETGATIGEAIRAANAQQLADERTDIARDMDRLANHKAALLDALGMDPTRDWDDIRNAARGLRKERDAQAEAVERVRQASTEPDAMNVQQEHPGVWRHGYHCGVLAAKSALRPRNEPTIKPTDA